MHRLHADVYHLMRFSTKCDRILLCRERSRRKPAAPGTVDRKAPAAAGDGEGQGQNGPTQHIRRLTGDPRPAATGNGILAMERRFDDIDEKPLEPARPPTAWPLARMVRDYWWLLRAGRGGAMPARSSIDPRAIGPALHSTFLASRVTMGLVRIRIGGRTLAGLAGIEVMDMPLSLLFVPESRAELALAVERVLSEGAVATIDLEAECTIGRPALSARLVLLPLVAPDETTTMMLGCFDCKGEIGRPRRRFAIARSWIEAGAAPAAVRRPEPPARPRPRPEPQAKLQAPHRPAAAPSGVAGGARQPRTCHLRLVHSV